MFVSHLFSVFSESGSDSCRLLVITNCKWVPSSQRVDVEKQIRVRTEKEVRGVNQARRVFVMIYSELAWEM